MQRWPPPESSEVLEAGTALEACAQPERLRTPTDPWADIEFSEEAHDLQGIRDSIISGQIRFLDAITALTASDEEAALRLANMLDVARASGMF